MTPSPSRTAIRIADEEPDSQADVAPVIEAKASDALSSTRNWPDRLSDDDIAKLAHELKTPLSAIVAASEIMRDERLGKIDNENYRGYAADIHSSARHAMALIERMLTTGGEAPGGTTELRFEPLDVNAIAEGCVSSMQPLAETANVNLSKRFDSQLKPLTADATSLRQILLNLLNNAVKFSCPGDSINVVTRIDAHGATTIEVRDTGPGMSRAEIARVLNAPAVPDYAPRAGGGKGLGLPLVRSLAEANAGRMTIDSAPGKGTAVIVTFPRNRLIAV